jgi:hypothetical protein
MSSPKEFISQAAQSQSLGDIIRQLEASLDKIGDQLLGLRPEQAAYKPSEKEWSVSEVIHHVTNSVKGMVHIADKLIHGVPFKRKLDSSGVGVTAHGVAVETLQQNLNAMRAEIRTKLSKWAEPIDEQATYEHPAFGPLSAKEWLTLNCLHNQRHLDQITRVKASQGYPK